MVAYLICFHSKSFFEIKNKLKSLLLSIVKTEKKITKQRYCYATGTESKSSANQFTQPVLNIFKWIQQFKIQEVFKNTRRGGILLRQAFNYVGVLAHRQLKQWSCAQPFEKVFCFVEPSGGSDREKEFSDQHFSKLSDSDRAIKIIMASKELDTTSTCCVVRENIYSLHLTRKSSRILSIDKWTHLMRVKFKEKSDRPGSHCE